MDSRSRRAALRAAARVALGGAVSVLVACGGQTTAGNAGGEEVDVGEDEGLEPQPSLLPRDPDPAGSSAAAREPAPISRPSPAVTAHPMPTASSAEPQASIDAGSHTGFADAAPSHGDGGSSAVPDGLACIGPVPFEPFEPLPVVGKGEFDCCVEHVLAHMAPEPDDAVVNCCSAIVQAAGLSSELIGGPVRDYCCADGLVAPTPDIWASQFCAPWGPPVPPAMPEAVA